MLAHLKIRKTSAINCHITSLQSQSLSCRNPGHTRFITSDNDDGDKDNDDDDDDGNEQGDDNDEDDEDGDERTRRKLCSVALLVKRRHLLALVALQSSGSRLVALVLVVALV